MIDVRELRIGDYVLLFNNTTPYRITEIGYSEIKENRYEVSGISSEGVFRTYIENLNPISITEGLLLNCGFKEVGFYDSVLSKDDIRIHFDKYKKTNIVLFVMYNEDDSVFQKEIHSFHQLQNLYFCLTGKELEVNFE